MRANYVPKDSASVCPAPGSGAADGYLVDKSSYKTPPAAVRRQAICLPNDLLEMGMNNSEGSLLFNLYNNCGTDGCKKRTTFDFIFLVFRTYARFCFLGMRKDKKWIYLLFDPKRCYHVYLR